MQCLGAPHDFAVYSMHSGLYAEDKCGSIAALALRGTPGAVVPNESGIWWLATAPDGTTFSRWQASFQGGGGSTAGWLISARVCADVYCYFPLQYLVLGLENWGAPVLRQWEGSGAVMLQFGLSCAFGAATACTVGGAPPGADMFAPEMILVDQFAPAQAQLTGGTLPGSGWQSGRLPHAVSFNAADRGGGVERVVASVASASWTQAAPCARGAAAYSRLVPCPLAFGGSIPINIAGLADGRHDLALTTIDAGGRQSVSGPYPMFVDNTAPAAPKNLTVVGGEGWRSRDDFGIRWDNPSDPYAPVAVAHWRLCAVGGACRDGQTTAAGIKGLDGLVTGGSGDYVLRVWLEDSAGNQNAANAAGPIHLRVDAEAPRPTFEPQNPADPLRVTVSVTDETSGLAGGAIEMRREGTASWQPLPTSTEPGRLVAFLDDENAPDGRYELRARAVDGAGNEGSTDRTRDGTRALVQLPVRIATRIQAGRRTTRMRRVAVRRKGRRRTVKRRTVTLESRVVSSSGKAVPLEGVIAATDGRPLADVDLDVQLAPKGSADYKSIGSVHTDANGRFGFRAHFGRSQSVRFRYPGSTHVRASVAVVEVGVRASSTIRTSERSVLNGQSIILRGRVRTQPVPANGKLVEVQAFFRDRWRTFSTVRTDRHGSWVLPYQFGGTVGTVKYRFRVRLPAEGGYEFETGSSPVKLVTVHGL